LDEAKDIRILVASRCATGGKYFSKVLTFYLAISLCYKASFVSHNLTVLPILVLELPFGANHIVSMRRIN
jgi:hypothetical protein